MKYKTLNIISMVAGISLTGILITQGIWLKRITATAEQQFNHRANKMLSCVVYELKTYSDTSKHISSTKYEDLVIFDVVDTVLLGNLVQKYSNYHNLNPVFNYALIESGSGKIIHKSADFKASQEENAHKACLSSHIWKKEYIHLSVFYPNKYKNIISKLLVWIIMSLFFTILSLSAVVYLIYNFFRQKKIAEIRNDFVNNMTHELKTPISTISVAAEVLIQSADNPEKSKITRYSKIIFDENQRMRKLVDKVLDIATLDKESIELSLEEVDIHSLICRTANNFCLDSCPTNAVVNYNLNAKNPLVKVDQLHMRNIINNLIDNAIKYSKESPVVDINTSCSNNYFVLSISDSGIGIPKDAINKVFDKFYRVPSGDIHNVKGFGLGLFYVKTMIEAHKGRVEIHSTPNKGTKIDLFIPQN